MSDTITMKENLEELTKGILEISDKLSEIEKDNIVNKKFERYIRKDPDWWHGGSD